MIAKSDPARRCSLPAALVLAVLLTAPSWAAEREYRLHFTAVMCFVAPCPDWEAIDTETGEKFYAVVDFSQLANPPSSSNDLVAVGVRTRLRRPKDDGSYERLSVSAIVKVTPSIPGYRP